jgi:hypothetical protein
LKRRMYAMSCHDVKALNAVSIFESDICPNKILLKF